MKELTTKQREVLDLLAKGKTTQEMADIMIVSIHTVKTHITNIFDKTGFNNRIELAVWWVQEKAKEGGITHGA